MINAYWLGVVSVIGIYAILATSYDISFGYAGVLAISQGAFYGIGAYTTAILMVDHQWPFLAALASSMLVAGSAGLAFAIPVTRLSGDYLLVASLTLTAVVYAVFVNWISVTNGPAGIRQIPDPSFFGLTVDSPGGIAAVILGFLGVSGLLIWRLVTSPFGRLLRALRDDPAALTSTGRDPAWLRAQALAISGAFAGLAGSLYAVFVGFVDPEAFILQTSFLVVVAVVIGGPGTFWGPVIGAAFIWMVPEALRFLDIPPRYKGPLNQVIYAAMVLAVIAVRPKGIVNRVKSLKRRQSALAATSLSTSSAARNETGTDAQGLVEPSHG